MSFAMPRFIEVAHPIRGGMRTYPGLPEPTVEALRTHEESADLYENRAAFYVASLHLCSSTGTYVDAPIHRFPDAADLSAYPLETLAHLDTLVIDATGYPSRGIGPDALRGAYLSQRAVLFHTGWSRRWGTERYFEANPFLTRETAEALREGGARFVGIDSLNIDDTADLSRPVHTILLSAGIAICEQMTNLAAVPPEGGRLHAVPIAWVGGPSFPVRAYVMVEDGD